MNAGKVIWYDLGRLYTDAKGQTFDAGFFTWIDRIEGSFFSSESKSEATAHFTFYADKFEGITIQNGDIAASLTPPGNWSMYLIREPKGDWNHPESFRGQESERIATWRRASPNMGAAVATTSDAGKHLDYSTGLSALTFELTSAEDFEWAGKRHNLKKYFPHGVTQIGLSSASSLEPLKDYPTVKAFAGTGLKVGDHGR